MPLPMALQSLNLGEQETEHSFLAETRENLVDMAGRPLRLINVGLGKGRRNDGQICPRRRHCQRPLISPAGA